MTIKEILERPTIGPGKTHESCFRVWATLEKVRELLIAGAPTGVIVDFISEIRDFPQKDMEP